MLYHLHQGRPGVSPSSPQMIRHTGQVLPRKRAKMCEYLRTAKHATAREVGEGGTLRMGEGAGRVLVVHM